jgi:hypothetical protein
MLSVFFPTLAHVTIVLYSKQSELELGYPTSFILLLICATGSKTSFVKQQHKRIVDLFHLE